MKIQYGLIVAVVLVVAGPTQAQVWTDDFTYAGSVLGNWVEHRGDWTALANQAKAAEFNPPPPSPFITFATQPTLSYKDCVAQCVVRINPSGQKNQVGGVALRVTNPANDKDMVAVEVRDVSGDMKFDTIMLTERTPTGTWYNRNPIRMPTPVTQVTVRMHVKDDRMSWVVDTDGNGEWDYGANTSIQNTPAITAPIGILGTYGVLIDDVKIYDAVVWTSGVWQPVMGNEYPLPIRGLPGKAYQAACALSNTGIPIPGGRFVPLWPDALFGASTGGALPTIFKNFGGFLDAQGDASPSIDFPVIPPLSGVILYFAFVTYDATGILQVSNDLQLKIS